MSVVWLVAGLAFVSVIVYDFTKQGGGGSAIVQGQANNVVTVFKDITGG